jgi:MFS family permease
MMPLRFFRIPAFSAGNIVAFAISLGMFGTWFFMSLYMQSIRGYTPLQAGVRFLPMTLMVIFGAPNAGRLASKYGSRWPMTIGLTLAGTGLLLTSRISATTSYGLMVPILMMMGLGMASTIAPMTAAVMNAVGPERAGLGSSMTNTSREVGGVFGIALLGSLLTTKLKSSLTPAISGLAIDPGLRERVIAAAGHGFIDKETFTALGPNAATVGHAYQAAFLSGFHLALLVAACVLYAAAFVAFRFVPGGSAAHTTYATAAGEPVPTH